MRLSLDEEKKYIERYKNGMTLMEACKIYKKAKRTIGEYEQYLRAKYNLPKRSELQVVELDEDLNDLSVRLSASKKVLRLENLTSDELQEIKNKYTLKWKPIKSKLRCNKSNQKGYKRILVTADYHVPYQNSDVIKCYLELMKDIKFDGFYILGDFMDMEVLSHWKLDKPSRRNLEGKRLLRDYAIGNALLDKFDELLPKNCDKRFWYGNHETWYYDFIERYPQLEGIFHPTKELKLKERGYKVYENINHIERIGKLAITHGMYTGVNFLNKHLHEFKTNLLIAHLHQMRMRFDSSPAKELAIAGYSIGSSCDMNPEYLQNKPHNWTHGCAIVYLFSDGCFDVHLIRIVKGRFVYNDKIYISK